MSPSERTNQDVTLNISSARDDDLLSITACTLEDGSPVTHTIAENGQSAQITAADNCRVKVTLSYGGETYERIFAINNIDRSAEAAVAWEYETYQPADGETTTAGRS